MSESDLVPLSLWAQRSHHLSSCRDHGDSRGSQGNRRGCARHGIRWRVWRLFQTARGDVGRQPPACHLCGTMNGGSGSSRGPGNPTREHASSNDRSGGGSGGGGVRDRSVVFCNVQTSSGCGGGRNCRRGSRGRLGRRCPRPGRPNQHSITAPRHPLPGFPALDFVCVCTCVKKGGRGKKIDACDGSTHRKTRRTFNTFFRCLRRRARRLTVLGPRTRRKIWKPRRKPSAWTWATSSWRFWRTLAHGERVVVWGLRRQQLWQRRASRLQMGTLPSACAPRRLFAGGAVVRVRLPRVVAVAPSLFLVVVAALLLHGTGSARAEGSGVPSCELSLDITNYTQNTMVSMDLLYKWCRADPKCTQEYHLDVVDEENAPGIFRHLVPQDLGSRTLFSPLAEVLCSSDHEVTLQGLWLRSLLIHRRTQAPLCGSDKTFVFDPDTNQQRCECKPDKPCSMATNDPVPLYVVYVLVVIIALALLAFSIVRNRNLLQALAMRTGDERAALDVLFQAATG